MFLLVGHVEKIEKNLPKAVTTAKLKRKGDCIFRIFVMPKVAAKKGHAHVEYNT